ncbi:MAG: hypothetical protein ACTSU5_02515, partial [Promethearchaeota archaeon]
MSASNSLLLKNAFVVDPRRGIDGEVMDLSVSGGKLVEGLEGSSFETVDVGGNLVVAGGIDIHSGVLSPAITRANLLGRGGYLSIPRVAERYARTGYTFVTEASVPPILSNQVLSNFRVLPVLDAGFLLELGSSWLTTLDLHEANFSRVAALYGYLLGLCKGLGVTATVPYESERWDEFEPPADIPRPGDSVKHFDLKLEDAFRGLASATRELSLVHPVHLVPHFPEFPGGSAHTRDFMGGLLDGLGGSSGGDVKPVVHWATAAAYCVREEESGPTLESREVADFFNGRENVELDLGLYSFHPPRPTGTPDKFAARFFEREFPSITHSVEMQAEYVAGFRAVREDVPLDVARWTAGLEVALLLESLDRVHFTVNHPSYGQIEDVPRLLALLASKKYRDEYTSRLGATMLGGAILPSLDREYDLPELVKITRDSPARSLGLVGKGSLAVDS